MIETAAEKRGGKKGTPDAANQTKRGAEEAPVKAEEGQKNPAEETENPEILDGMPAWWHKLMEVLKEEAQHTHQNQAVAPLRENSKPVEAGKHESRNNQRRDHSKVREKAGKAGKGNKVEREGA